MRIGVAATPSVAIPTLDWLVGSRHDLDLIITRPDRPAGRGRALKESLVGQWASTHAIAVMKPVASQELVESLAFLDLVVTIGYGVILPSEVLSIPHFGFINLHFSLLPLWRGAAPVQRTILNGDEISGVTVFSLDSGMDTGPIYIQHEIPLHPYENAGELLARLANLGPESVEATISMIESGIPPAPQNLAKVSYAPKISKEEARIEWVNDVNMIDRQIRAFSPEPGAWTLWRGSTFRIDRARPFPIEESLAPGFLMVKDGAVIVGCAHGRALILEEVTPAGKKTMTAKSWGNGARIMDGAHFV